MALNANLFRSEESRNIVESNITGSKTLVHENRFVKMEKRAEEEYFCSREWRGEEGGGFSN